MSSSTSINRRRLVRGAAAAVLGAMGPWQVHHAWAQARGKKPLRIGLTTDDTGQYGASGQDEQRGILMAVHEANERGGVLGRPIETVHADTGGDPAKATAVARHMLEQQDCAFLVGAVHSGAASAISTVAQRHGCIYFNTNSSSPTEAGKDCHRTKFVWDGNGTNFSTSIVRGAMTGFGREWALITSDYAWGRSTAQGIRAIVEGNGGTIVQEMVVPQNTRDFSAQLQRIQQIKPGVIATAVGGDDVKALREQVRGAKMDRIFGWINNQQDWPDVYGAGPEVLFGIFGTTWYWGLRLAGVAEFNARYAKANPGYRIRKPGNVFYNGYMATRELLRAIERVGSTHNIRLIKELEALRIPAAQRMQHHDAWMNPATHQLQQTIYMAAYNTQPREPDDSFRILGQQRPDEVQDRDSLRTCQLESYAATPTFEP
ncbi:branched-chain amino acid transport system substrate-binding protein [Acidovorax soli]|uniref:Branched-chain amino acid transport system substrate-binding protein n=1 Tax=Acidovorax soli TaxID=592050 RepID=A0A7X0PH96_9BURK|nr:ABC transporter substrate-binding protein [Acidovorax soli]MBB6561851.1 branched-chain amino acid transport system substrate-binding protein [Acidovorax soli]